MSLHAVTYRTTGERASNREGRSSVAFGLGTFKHQDDGSQGSRLDMLARTWRVAIRPGNRLPLFEDVALDNMVRLTDDVAILEFAPPAAPRILRAGANFASWVGGGPSTTPVSDLRPDCGRLLDEAVRSACATLEPSRRVTHRVADGYVDTFDLLAMPLENRWGPPLIVAYVESRNERFNLVDTVFQATEDGMMALAAERDAQGCIIDFHVIAANAGASRILGREDEALDWKRWSEIGAALSGVDLVARFSAAVSARQRDRVEINLDAGAGPRTLSIGISPAGDLLTMTMSDVTELKTREQAFRLLFEENPVPMWLHDPQTGRILRVNDAAVDHYGYDRERFLAMPLDEITDGAQDPGENDQKVRRHTRADGSVIEVQPYSRSVVISDRPAILTGIIDVTERRRSEARISFMASHDPLTRLANRTKFQHDLEAALAGMSPSGPRPALFCLDLDHFKTINDTLGHPFGDKLLVEVADRLRLLTSGIGCAARLGGDEFAVLLHDQDTSGAPERQARRMIRELSRPYRIDGHEVRIGASIGIALAPAHGRTKSDLMQSADLALYRSKATGRGLGTLYDPDMERERQVRHRLESDLRAALDQGQLFLSYQPLVGPSETGTGGFEALLRWAHPERGIVPPGAFVPLAEEIGIIPEIGEWVLRQACLEACEWPERMFVAVNLSAQQFRRGGLVTSVAEALGASGLSPNRLQLEVTETVLLEESEANIATLHALKDLGVSIVMDDFGTGYSSLDYVLKFPFDKIKIDRAFVARLADSPKALAIIRAVLGLATDLGIATTAEGIETEAQRDLLRSEGCVEMQGFLFGRPMAPDRIPDHLAGEAEAAGRAHGAPGVTGRDGPPGRGKDIILIKG